MSNFERRQNITINTLLEHPEPSTTSFSTLIPDNDPSYDEPPLYPPLLPPNNSLMVCLNSIAQSRYGISTSDMIACTCPTLAQNVAIDIAKAQLYDDPEIMHKQLIKLHNVHTNLQIDLLKIANNLSKIPTFHPKRHNSLRVWFRKSRTMIFGSISGLLLSLITVTMIYVVVKLRLILNIFG